MYEKEIETIKECVRFTDNVIGICRTIIKMFKFYHFRCLMDYNLIYQ